MEGERRIPRRYNHEKKAGRRGRRQANSSVSGEELRDTLSTATGTTSAAPADNLGADDFNFPTNKLHISETLNRHVEKLNRGVASGDSWRNESDVKINETVDAERDEWRNQLDGVEMTDEQRLLAMLRRGYDRHTRPVFNASHAVTVKLGITLSQIFDVDERNQVMTTHIWLDQEWYDEKMKWDPDEYNGLTTLRVPCHLLWKPDIVLYNSADDYKDGYMPSLAMVSYDGHVFWPPIVKLRSTCKIDITYFPFDDQMCDLKLGSWAYDGNQVDVLKRDRTIDLTNYVNNGEWELVDVKVIRHVKKYSCCPEPYPDVTFYLHLRRRTLYYTYNVIIPCIMLSSLTLLEFWMPPEGGEKVALGLTVLLAYSVFMLLIAENMPATSFYVPLIGVYIIVVMGLSSVSVMFAVIVSNLHHQSIMDRDVPQNLRRFVSKINKWVKVPPRRRSCLTQPSTTETTPDLKTPLRGSLTSISTMNFRNDDEVFDMTYINEHTNRDKYGNNSVEPSKQRRDNNSRNSTNSFKDNNSRMRRRAERRSSATTEEILRGLQLLLHRQEQLIRPRGHSDVNREWHEVAEIVDRFLFWIYSTFTVMITILILVLVPLGKSVTI